MSKLHRPARETTDWNANTYVDKGEKGKGKSKTPEEREDARGRLGTRQSMKTVRFAVVFVILAMRK